ncbi:DUF3168 domain-containing protein [Marinovum sp. 2_MG-2023]|uniref:DUF3168 domain-containing protein n=1 Tax=Roseobacteraceae TaxID=2854170 RepID=UPI001FD61B75|nr:MULTISPECIES: DUF3168 domain-containing protein [Roseobacteraceae]MCJ7873744.1 DUF3168 domain-containing protein [Phaeobacter sp. J2-8]MDO6731019.1 DUF3168 domain-containing protein [Marinovum sp. 2_MG-2023]MDO6778516.1 DUF3168 domain-containing protein [Marinovum sp. 1_MG-2023]
MSYAVAVALQTALYQHLSADAALGAIVGSAIYDAIPSGSLPSIYVTLGTETARDRSDQTGNGAAHDIGISIITDAPGFQQAKEAAVAVSDALDDPALALSRGSLVGLWFQRAKATRDTTAGTRRIDMIFRARVEDN